VVTNQGFSTKIGTWGYDKNKRAHTIQNKIDQFNEQLSERLKRVQIEQNDAHKVIKSRDTEESFVYADPPYIDSNQGHYGGYSHEHYERDLQALQAMQGKFLLSSYPSEILNKYIKENGWHTRQVEKILSASNGATQKKRKTKIEVLTANYLI
jgi:DNA adenine methylase